MSPSKSLAIATNLKKLTIKEIKTILRKCLPAIDLLLLPMILPSGLIMKSYRRIGSDRLAKTTKLLRIIGTFPIIRNYYEPLFDTQLLVRNKLYNRNLPRLQMDVEKQKVFLTNLTFANELLALDLTNAKDVNLNFYIDNGSFESGDAEFLYQVIRFLEPNQVVEIGGGESTKIIQLASRKNVIQSKHLCIEPFEMGWLDGLNGIDLIRQKIEDTNIDWSEILKANDLLFIDSSHMVRPQGDVLYEYLEILPQLSKGVYIHIHDIFTPRDYPESFLVNEIRFWNEQYLLEAISSNSNRYEIVAGLNYLKQNFFSELKGVAPYLNLNNEPGSIYLRVVN